jgi:hypothetical protein
MRSKKQRTDELGKEKQTIGKVEEVDLWRGFLCRRAKALGYLLLVIRWRWPRNEGTIRTRKRACHERSEVWRELEACHERSEVWRELATRGLLAHRCSSKWRSEELKEKSEAKSTTKEFCGNKRYYEPSCVLCPHHVLLFCYCLLLTSLFSFHSCSCTLLKPINQSINQSIYCCRNNDSIKTTSRFSRPCDGVLLFSTSHGHHVYSTRRRLFVLHDGS